MKHVDIPCFDPSYVQPSVVSAAIGRLEKVDTYGWFLTFQHIQSVIEDIVNGQSTLRILHLDDEDLSHILPAVLSAAVGRLEEVSFAQMTLSNEQIEAVLEEIATGKTVLKKFSLEYQDISNVKPALLAAAVGRLEEVKFKFDNASPRLTTEQAEAMLEAISTGNTSLRVLHLKDEGTARIQPGVLASACNQLEEVYFTTLSTEQLNCILRHSVKQDTKLRRLEVVGKMLNRWDNDSDDDEDLVHQVTYIMSLDRCIGLIKKMMPLGAGVLMRRVLACRTIEERRKF